MIWMASMLITWRQPPGNSNLLDLVPGRQLIISIKPKRLLVNPREKFGFLYPRSTLQGINISHLRKRKIIFKYAISGGYVNPLEGRQFRSCIIFQKSKPQPKNKNITVEGSFVSPRYNERATRFFLGGRFALS